MQNARHLTAWKGFDAAIFNNYDFCTPLYLADWCNVHTHTHTPTCLPMYISFHWNRGRDRQGEWESQSENEAKARRWCQWKRREDFYIFMMVLSCSTTQRVYKNPFVLIQKSEIHFADEKIWKARCAHVLWHRRVWREIFFIYFFFRLQNDIHGYVNVSMKRSPWDQRKANRLEGNFIYKRHQSQRNHCECIRS